MYKLNIVRERERDKSLFCDVRWLIPTWPDMLGWWQQSVVFHHIYTQWSICRAEKKLQYRERVKRGIYKRCLAMLVVIIIITNEPCPCTAARAHRHTLRFIGTGTVRRVQCSLSLYPVGHAMCKQRKPAWPCHLRLRSGRLFDLLHLLFLFLLPLPLLRVLLRLLLLLLVLLLVVRLTEIIYVYTYIYTCTVYIGFSLWFSLSFFYACASVRDLGFPDAGCVHNGKREEVEVVEVVEVGCRRNGRREENGVRERESYNQNKGGQKKRERERERRHSHGRPSSLSRPNEGVKRENRLGKTE